MARVVVGARAPPCPAPGAHKGSPLRFVPGNGPTGPVAARRPVAHPPQCILTIRAVAHGASGVTGNHMSLGDRIGFDAGSARLEDALAWAAENGFYYVDFNADVGPNHLDAWSDTRIRTVRRFAQSHDIHLGLHTLSAVNVAEYSPHVSRAVDQYLRANIDFANRMGCEWIVVHAGYHFTADPDARMAAAVERLARVCAYAADTGARLLLENLNFEPDRAEVHYLAHNVSELSRFFESIPPALLGWAFTVNHAHLVPEGIHGFLDRFGIDRIGEVRLADNTGEYETHMVPGEGTIDFAGLFSRLEDSGYQRHYTMAYGSSEQKLRSRASLAALRG